MEFILALNPTSAHPLDKMPWLSTENVFELSGANAVIHWCKKSLVYLLTQPNPIISPFEFCSKLEEIINSSYLEPI